jgi:ubiquinone/menaquinone biosynthesis C-methylase UbiE
MSESKVVFDDGDAYERLMGRWSRATGAIFLEWLAPGTDATWLDVGCGTGVFTQLVLDTCKPRSIAAVDPSAAQIEHARTLPIAGQVEFKVGDAVHLPFPDRSFDIVASALVINFIADPAQGVRQMVRVARTGGTVAGYVWDFADMHTPGWPLARGLLAVGVTPPVLPGTTVSTLDALQTLFLSAGLVDVGTKAIDVSMQYRDFDDYWNSATPRFLPSVQAIAALPQSDQSRVRDIVRGLVSFGAHGQVAFAARAHAVKGRVPA